MLNVHEKRRGALLGLGILLNGLVEILGLASVIPVIGLVVDPQSIETNPTIRQFYHGSHAIGVESPNDFLIGLCLVLVAAFIFKGFFGLSIAYLQTRFSFEVAHRLSGAMWSFHFKKSLQRLRSTDSGKVLSEINYWPIQFANAFLVGGLLILSESAVIFLIALGLIAYNPFVFIGIGFTLALGAGTIRLLTKKRLSYYGQIKERLEPRSNLLINNAIHGFLEVVTFRATEAVKNNYLADRKVIFRILGNTLVVNMVPAKLYEMLAVLAISASICLSLTFEFNNAEFVSLLSLMAIGAYRIMPSLSRINGAVMNIQASYYMLNSLEEGAQSVLRKDWRQDHCVILPDSGTIQISIDKIELSYDNLSQSILSNVSHDFDAGKMHAIVGPSGSGKSTLVSALLGLHPPQSGRIQVHFSATPESRFELGAELKANNWLSQVGYLSQSPFLFQGTVMDNLKMGMDGTHVDESAFHDLCCQLQLTDCLGQDPLKFHLHEGGNNLSGGQRQRLALARALLFPRKILILDEATSALDDALKETVHQILQNRARKGDTIILVTHDERLAQKCDAILNLEKVASPNSTSS